MKTSSNRNIPSDKIANTSRVLVSLFWNEKQSTLSSICITLFDTIYSSHWEKRAVVCSIQNNKVNILLVIHIKCIWHEREMINHNSMVTSIQYSENVHLPFVCFSSSLHYIRIIFFFSHAKLKKNAFTQWFCVSYYYLTANLSLFFMRQNLIVRFYVVECSL